MAFSKGQEFFIHLLRSHLSMRLASAAGSSYILDNKLGDEELWEDLRNGLSMFNGSPPFITSYSFKDLYKASLQAEDIGDNPAAPETETYESGFITPILMCSLFFTGLRLQWFEAGKHFEYNDNGISIMRKKQMDYSNIVGGNILQYLNVQLILIKKALAMRGFPPKGLFSGSVGFPRSLTRGLRGTRLGASF